MLANRALYAGGAAALLVLAAMSIYFLMPSQTRAEGPPVYTNSATGIAINGYDPVSYFTVGEPVAGRTEFSAEWGGAPWHFASAENRELFLADPERYAPQYGGWCAFAMAQSSYAPTIPEAWTVRDGKLYLNFSGGVRDQWLSDADHLISRADAYWAQQ